MRTNDELIRHTLCLRSIIKKNEMIIAMASMIHHTHKSSHIGVLSSVICDLEDTISCLGADPRPVLLHFGIEHTDLKTIQKISLNDFCQAITIAEGLTGNKNFALFYGARCKLKSLGLLGYLFQNSATLFDGLKACVEYFPCHQEFSEMQLIKVGKYYRLDYQVDKHHLYERRADAEISLAMFCNLIRQVLGENWKPVRVGFEQSQPPQIKDHQSFFGLDLVFNYPQNSIYLSAEDLKKPILGADLFLFEIIKKALIQDGFSLSDQDRFLKQVDKIIEQKIKLGIPRIEDVATELAIPVWTFKRKLAQLEVKFSELVEARQKKVAVEHLENSQESISEIAYQLGYTDISSFSKAFHRWYGQSPKLWRAEHQF